MPRKFKFQNDKYYHIYNRGVDKRGIFDCDKDYIRFLMGIRKFNTTEVTGGFYKSNFREDTKCPIGHLVSKNALVDIICYCLIPNHYHFLLKQIKEDGISKFLHKIEMGYAKYFNYKYSRSGSLFQGTYQAAEIKTEGKL